MWRSAVAVLTLCPLLLAPAGHAAKILGWAVIGSVSHQLNVATGDLTATGKWPTPDLHASYLSSHSAAVGQTLAARGHQFDLVLADTELYSQEVLRAQLPGISLVTYKGAPLVVHSHRARCSGAAGSRSCTGAAGFQLLGQLEGVDRTAARDPLKAS